MKARGSVWFIGLTRVMLALYLAFGLLVVSDAGKDHEKSGRREGQSLG